MNKLKITLAILFVLVVSFFVVRGCVQRKPLSHEVTPKKVLKKKVTVRKETAKEIAPPEASTGPRMAIILDDWGNSMVPMKYALAIQRPLTLAILPHLPYSDKIAEEAYQNNLGVMLHMPMQAQAKQRALEPHTLTSDMSDKTIITYLDSAIASIPHVEGVNNHQGSGAVTDLRMMNLILGHLMEKGLFFIDSYTTAKTVAPQVARRLGIKFTRRDVFIDDEMTPEAIKAQIEKAINKALKRGRVVVIGHDRKMTLMVLREMIPKIEQVGVRLVFVRELLE